MLDSTSTIIKKNKSRRAFYTFQTLPFSVSSCFVNLVSNIGLILMLLVSTAERREKPFSENICRPGEF